MDRHLKLIDAHCHINFSAYRDDADEVISRSLDEGIGMFAVGSQSTTSRRAVEYADRFDDVWAVIGLHPIHLFEQDVDESETPGGEGAQFRSRAEEFDEKFYRGLIKGSDSVVGIGECGLDYYHRPGGVDSDEFRARQQDAFRAQIELALDTGLALMIHSRDAADGSTDVHGDIIALLREYADRGLRGDVHCFSGSPDQAQEYLKLGLYLSFTGNVTYKPRRSDIERGWTLEDVVRAVPPERILVETDAPYLTPVPHRGERNEPRYVRYVAERIAEIKGLARDDFSEQTLQNTRELFRI
ncbi:TatD family hydrolase [Patescibacteria group bacterium]